MPTVTLRGHAAITYAETHGGSLTCAGCEEPAEGPRYSGRTDLTVEEALAVAREDAGLISILVEQSTDLDT